MSKNKIEFSWNVWTWDSNHNGVVVTDVGPYFVNAYFALPKAKRPSTKETISSFLDSEASYMYWSRCEYEMTISGLFKNDKMIKKDVYNQLELNWDHFVNAFINAINTKKGKDKDASGV